MSLSSHKYSIILFVLAYPIGGDHPGVFLDAGGGRRRRFLSAEAAVFAEPLVDGQHEEQEAGEEDEEARDVEGQLVRARHVV